MKNDLKPSIIRFACPAATLRAVTFLQTCYWSLARFAKFGPEARWCVVSGVSECVVRGMEGIS